MSNINDRQRAAAKAIAYYLPAGADLTEASLRQCGRTTHQLGVACALVDLDEEVAYVCASPALASSAQYAVAKLYGDRYAREITFIPTQRAGRRSLEGRSGRIIYDHHKQPPRPQPLPQHGGQPPMSNEPKVTAAFLGALVKGDIGNAIIASTPGGIEAQEAAGQTWFQTAGVLPKELMPGKAELESIGFTFGADYDDIFVHATLPEGWYFKVTNHDLHTTVHDASGVERGSISYKAAFYDRRSNMHLKRRYIVYREYVDESDIDSGAREAVIDNKTGAVVFVHDETFHTLYGGEEKPTQEEIRANYERKEADRTKCKEWAAEHYPDYENALAYWDAPE